MRKRKSFSMLLILAMVVSLFAPVSITAEELEGAAPTDIDLSNSSVAENAASGTAVGTLSATDADPGDFFVFSLVSGTGDTGNASFTVDVIDNSTASLLTAASFDYETQNSYSIRVQVADSFSLTYSEAFTISVTDVNENTGITLSNFNVSNVDADSADVSFTSNRVNSPEALAYVAVLVLPASEPAPANADAIIDISSNFPAPSYFQITSASVQFTADKYFDGTSMVNLVKGTTYTIYVVGGYVDPATGTTYSSILSSSFTPSDVNQAPTDISLSNSSVAENAAVGTAVGDFSATDPDEVSSSGTATYTYSFVTGDGDFAIDNFTIDGSTLKTGASFDFETQDYYAVRVQVADSGGLKYAKFFPIFITNVNESPTDIALSNSSIAENESAGTLVGDFSTTDPDDSAPQAGALNGSSFTYSLVQGDGDSDNASFTIDGSTLKTAASFDYETQNSYSVRVQVADSGSLTYEETFTISVTDVNEDTGITLSDLAISNVDTDSADVSFSSNKLTDGEFGAAYLYLVLTASDTAPTQEELLQVASGFDTPTGGPIESSPVSFSVDKYYNGTELVALAPGTAYKIYILGAYAELLSTSAEYSQIISDSFTTEGANQAPTDIELSNDSVAENEATCTTVGELSAIDPDDSTVGADAAAETFKFSLVPGDGSADNGSFSIDGTTLKTGESFDYETKNSYMIRVQVADSGSLTYEETFTINVTDVIENSAPTDIALSNNSVAENEAVGTAVGDFSAVDPDNANAGVAETATFTLEAGEGDADNGSFTIDGTTLKTAASFNFESKSSYSIRVRVTDSGGLTYEEAFVIGVTDVAENFAPTDINLSSSDIDENEDIGDNVGKLTAVDPNIGDTFTFALVSGEGDSGNASFAIDGNYLESAIVFDYETQNSYSIRVQVTDSGGLTYEEVFTITINDEFENKAPTDIQLSNSSVNEHAPLGTIVGLLSATDEDGNYFKYEIEDIDGDDDSQTFGIRGNILFARTYLDFEKQSSYQVRIEVEDRYDGEYEEVFTITVNDIDESTETLAPTTPTNLRADNVTRTSLRLQWRASSDNVGVAGYEIYRNGILLTTVTSTSFVVNGLVANTSYAFTVRAFDAAGNKSASTAPLNVRTKR